MNNPLISIITVTYNAQEHLEETMQHVFAQSYPNVEYILIDGGSTDGTIRFYKRLFLVLFFEDDKYAKNEEINHGLYSWKDGENRKVFCEINK
ncbi:family 2 glycosyl transferase [Candidatus Symbiothrix dinenymphae]|nr:family 2 glycosyl transferase [Candidatus Symbiothrix dinenymphae]